MKFAKQGFLALAAVVGVSSSMFMTSCEKDSCTSLQCKNGGTCADEFCRCPSGFEGAECEIRVADKFLGKWYGITQCSIPGFRDSLGPAYNDTVIAFMAEAPNKVGITRWRVPGDTVYGRADGQQLLIDDVVSGNSTKNAKLVYNGRVITYFTLNTPNINSVNGQYSCTFTGYPDTTYRIPQQ